MASVTCLHSLFPFIYNSLLYSVPAVKTKVDFLSLSLLGAVDEEEVSDTFQEGSGRVLRSAWEPSNFISARTAAWQLKAAPCGTEPAWDADSDNNTPIKKGPH